MKASSMTPVSQSALREFGIISADIESNPYHRLAQALDLGDSGDYFSRKGFSIDDFRPTLELIAENRADKTLSSIARYLIWRVEINVRRRGFAGPVVPIYRTDLMDAARALFSYAIPTPAAISTIARHVLSAQSGSLIEIGAGTGYWSALLSHAGLAVRACDNRSWKISSLWHPVVQAPARIAADSSPTDTLLLCWPPYDKRMAEIALRVFKGRTVVYVGEGAEGCTGGRSFHRVLAESWDLIETTPIPQWPGMHDEVRIYTRR